MRLYGLLLNRPSADGTDELRYEFQAEFDDPAGVDLEIPMEAELAIGVWATNTDTVLVICGIALHKISQRAIRLI